MNDINIGFRLPQEYNKILQDMAHYKNVSKSSLLRYFVLEKIREVTPTGDHPTDIARYWSDLRLYGITISLFE